jgi:DNA phosphorothioation-dependent restriction protein DptG
MDASEADQELTRVFARMQTLNDLMADQEPKKRAGLRNDFDSLYEEYHQWRDYSRRLEAIIYPE